MFCITTPFYFAFIATRKHKIKNEELSSHLKCGNTSIWPDLATREPSHFFKSKTSYFNYFEKTQCSNENIFPQLH